MKTPSTGRRADLLRLHVLHVERLDQLFADDAPRHRVPDELHLGVGEGALLGDLLGAQLVAAVHHVDLVGELGEEHALLDGGVAAADHGHRLALVEGAVAGGAPRHAAPDELGLAGDARELRHHARRQDDGAGADALLVGGDAEGAVLLGLQ